MPLPILCDEHIPSQIFEGLRRRGVDVITVQELGLRSSQDQSILDFARQQARVIYTNDADFLRLHASGVQHCGIIYHHMLDYSIGAAIRTVAFASDVLSIEEMRNRVEFV